MTDQNLEYGLPDITRVDIPPYQPTPEELSPKDIDDILSPLQIGAYFRWLQDEQGVLIAGRRHSDRIQLDRYLQFMLKMTPVDTIAIEGPPQLQPILDASFIDHNEVAVSALGKISLYYAYNPWLQHLNYHGYLHI